MKTKGFVLFYSALLRLFPNPFRSEFRGEMQLVFEEALDDADQGGVLELARTMLKEYGQLICEALRQHLNRSISRAGWQGPPSRGEVLVALAIFLLPTVFIFMNAFPGLSSHLVWSFIGTVFLAVFFAGLLRGFPRWSLPYLGLALSLLSFVFVFQWIADLIAPLALSRFGLVARDETMQLLLQAFWAGLLWLSLLTLTALALGCLALLRRFRLLLGCIRQDWTLASYILYYGTTLTLFLAYDQHHSKPQFALASVLCLACGAWFYLRGDHPWQRILALTSGLSLAMLATLAARWPILSNGDWTHWSSVHLANADAWPAGGWTIFDWGWALLLLLAPALLRTIGKGGKHLYGGAGT
jgi:hypothetical protein